MGFLQQLLGTDKQANVRKLSPAEMQALKEWPLFKASYADMEIHNHKNQRGGTSDPFEPFYETASLSREDFNKFNSAREAINRKLGVSIGAESVRSSFYTDKASYQLIAEYQRLAMESQVVRSR